MEKSITGLGPIPVDYIRHYALRKATEPRRRPYAELISDWGSEQGQTEAAQAVASSIIAGATGGIDERKRRKTLLSLNTTFRTGERLERLTTLLGETNELMQSRSVDWTWAHVMRVMLEHGLLTTRVPNRFDELVCMLVAGKGTGTVRKNGNYQIIETARPYTQWIENPRDDFEEANDRRICVEIAAKLEPLLFND